MCVKQFHGFKETWEEMIPKYQCDHRERGGQIKTQINEDYFQRNNILKN